MFIQPMRGNKLVIVTCTALGPATDHVVSAVSVFLGAKAMVTTLLVLTYQRMHSVKALSHSIQLNVQRDKTLTARLRKSLPGHTVKSSIS